MGDHPRKSIFEIENQAEIYKQLKRKKLYDFSVNERGTLFYWWSIIVSFSCGYNLLFVTFLVFEDIRIHQYNNWIMFNFITDGISMLDMVVQSRRSYYENGVKTTSTSETRWNYVKSYRFMMDFVAVLPTDVVLFVDYDFSLVRINRLFKCYRIADMFDLAERRNKYQFPITFAKIILTCTLLFHWNACAFYVLSTVSLAIANKTRQELDEGDWPFNFWKITDAYVTHCEHFTHVHCGFNESGRNIEHRELYIDELYDYWRDRKQRIEFSNFSKEYSLSMYWSSLTMTTLGEQPEPNLTFQNIFEIFDTLIGMIIFAMIMGSVGDLVSSANAFKTEIQMQMDGLKQYMMYRNLDNTLQDRVLKYCEYEMSKQQSVNEHNVRSYLPKKLFIQVNKFVQWRMLKRSVLFQACESSFLSDLASKMCSFSFGPGDVVTAKGDLNKEMIVVCMGELREIDDSGVILKCLNEESIYGETSLVWFPEHKHLNRRVNSVFSYGYSEVYILHRDDFLEVLHDYPSMKTKIYVTARELLIVEGEVDDVYKEEDDDDFKPLEELLRDMADIVNDMETTLNKQREAFNRTSSEFKRRVFELEMVFKKHRVVIKRDLGMRTKEKPKL